MCGIFFIGGSPSPHPGQGHRWPRVTQGQRPKAEMFPGAPGVQGQAWSSRLCLASRSRLFLRPGQGSPPSLKVSSLLRATSSHMLHRGAGSRAGHFWWGEPACAALTHCFPLPHRRVAVDGGIGAEEVGAQLVGSRAGPALCSQAAWVPRSRAQAFPGTSADSAQHHQTQRFFFRELVNSH